MFNGVLKKMITEFSDPIRYFLDLESDFIEMNQCIDHQISIKYNGQECLNCNKERSIFRMGYCKKCFFESPATGDWIIRPELSNAHKGIEDRDLEYEKKMQIQPHIVYLSLTSQLKIGVTRKNQLYTRWIDQGAYEAIKLLELPNRYLAGVAEVHFKKIFSDRTYSNKMLQNNFENIDWDIERERALNYLPSNYKKYIVEEIKTTRFNFPVLKIPTKVRRLKLEKENIYKGLLKGIKGQYLIFEDNTVFGVRAHEGTKVEIKIDQD